MDDYSGGTDQGIENPHRENLSPQDIKGAGDKYYDNPHKNNSKKGYGNQDHYSYFDWYQRTDNFTADNRPHLKASLSDKLIWADMTLNNRKKGQSPVIDYVKYNRLIHEKESVPPPARNKPGRLVSMGSRSLPAGGRRR